MIHWDSPELPCRLGETRCFPVSARRLLPKSTAMTRPCGGWRTEGCHLDASMVEGLRRCRVIGRLVRLSIQPHTPGCEKHGEIVMIDWGTVPQWLTAGIVGGALGAAVISITSQRETARKRAAVDFFLKTDLDANMLQAHAAFESALKQLQEYAA